MSYVKNEPNIYGEGVITDILNVLCEYERRLIRLELRVLLPMHRDHSAEISLDSGNGKREGGWLCLFASERKCPSLAYLIV